MSGSIAFEWRKVFLKTVLNRVCRLRWWLQILSWWRGRQMKETTGDLKIEFSGFRAKIWNVLCLTRRWSNWEISHHIRCRKPHFGWGILGKTWQGVPPIHLLVRSQNFEKRLLASSCLSVHMEQVGSHLTDIHPLTPNVNYSGRTAPLTSIVAFYIFIQQI